MKLFTDLTWRLKITQDHWRWHNSIGYIIFSLVFCSNRVSISYRFCMRYSSSNKGVSLKCGSGVIQVIENGTIRQILYDFLAVCRCKYLVAFSRYLTSKNIVTIKSKLGVIFILRIFAQFVHSWNLQIRGYLLVADSMDLYLPNSTPPAPAEAESL